MYFRWREDEIPRRRLSRRGFTLAELSIVTLIISLLAAVSVPRYISALTQYQAELAATRIKLDFEAVRQSARKASAAKAIAFDVTNGTYSIASMNDLNHPGLGTYTVKLRQAPYSVRLESANCGGDAILIFDGYGKPDSTATIVVVSGSVTKTITVAATSGKVNIQ